MILKDWQTRAVGLLEEGQVQTSTALHGGPEPAWLAARASLAVAAGYFLGSLLGLSLSFPATQISVIWPPNAILLAAFLVTPLRRWWIYLAAVLPAHLLAQGLMGIPWPIVLVNFVGNTGDSLLGALMIRPFIGEPMRLARLRAVTAVILLGGLFAPVLVSLVVAGLFVAIGASTAPLLDWQLRLLTNGIAVLTLVPLIVLAATRDRSRRPAVSPQRSGEAGILLTLLLVVGILVFTLPKAESGQSQLLLYLPLPLLLWAAVRFGLMGVCLSVLTLGGLAMEAAVQGRGPFVTPDPIANATSLLLFLNFTCASFLVLASMLEERRSVEEERRREETLYREVLASVPDEIAVLDRDGVILGVNPAWCAAGRPAVGSDFLAACKLLAERSGGSAVRMLAGLEAVLSGARQRFQLGDTLSSGVWLETAVQGLKRAEGGAVVTHTDITSRKQAELEARDRRRELTHLTRVALLGELSGALAHELNQPLTAILSNAQTAQRLLSREPLDLAEVREILHDIAADDRRAGQVIQRLRAMLKKEEAKLVPLDLNEVVQEVLGLEHSDLITRNVTAIPHLAPGLPPVYGDRVQLQQVLLNLVLNASEAMSGKPIGERRITLVTAREGQEAIQVSVIDRGTGIPADELERVFEPFFTTREHGLGLGLPICRSIVEAHGGRLWVSNNDDCGATFHLTLPLHGSEPGAFLSTGRAME